MNAAATSTPAPQPRPGAIDGGAATLPDPVPPAAPGRSIARRAPLALAFLSALVLLASAAPLLGLRDPTALSRVKNLPPGSTVLVLPTVDGGVEYARELRRSDTGFEVRYQRRWRPLPRDVLVEGLQSGPRPRERFWLGSDRLGRDLLSRLVHGARTSLWIGLWGALVGTMVGGLLGLCAGLRGGWIDEGLMRVTDLFLSIPQLFLALLIVAVWSRSMSTTIAVLAATTWMAAARLVRGEVLAARSRGWAKAARAVGVSPWRLGWRHLMPAAYPPLLVESSLRLADVILLESSLSFLGLGVPPPAASWGSLIADGRGQLLQAWWISSLPCLAIVATVIALHRLFGASAWRRRSGRRPAAEATS